MCITKWQALVGQVEGSGDLVAVASVHATVRSVRGWNRHGLDKKGY